MNLPDKQAAMRTRMAYANSCLLAKKRGRPVKPPHPPLPPLDLDQVERRIRAWFLLKRGWSRSRVAIELNVPLDALVSWIELGMPLPKLNL